MPLKSEMKFIIRHEIRGRIRISLAQKCLTVREADCLEQYLLALPGVTGVKIYERTAGAAILYDGSREVLLQGIKEYSGEEKREYEPAIQSSTRRLNQEFREKMLLKILIRLVTKNFFPAPLRSLYVSFRAVHYIAKGYRALRFRRLRVEVLDATAITVSLLRRDFKTAGSVMFLLGIGELLEEWTHKKSVGDLARSMSLNVEKVWKRVGETEVLVPISRILPGDDITVRMGNVIPLDGVVQEGEAMVNQASMTGESVPVRKEKGVCVYAGTVVEEGEITFRVKTSAGTTRYDRIVRMIENSERMKSSVEGKAAGLADALVPWSLGATAAVGLITGNAAKALSVLMVDFSCALKLAMPLAVLSAMREATRYRITVKGGKYLEAVADAKTIVFDKTGTLTKAKPVVARIVSFNGMEENELLRIAACLEEHFPHSIASAVVHEAVSRGLVHEEMHSRVDYVVAHGIATYVGEERIVIGSHHFVFEDEKCVLPENGKEKYASLPEEYSHLYMAIGGCLAAVICIEDPIREEAGDVVKELRKLGFDRIVMMTGDSEKTAASVAQRIGVDDCFSEVLPEDKARFVEEEKKKGRKVVMTGDGINDSPALSAADAGIAVSEGAALAREIADITIAGDSLMQLVVLRRLSQALMKRVNANYRFVIGFNLGLILLGIGGIITPATSAFLHNSSTLAVGIKSMTNLLPEQIPIA